ncbi:MAG: dihydrolipoyl dehydrogenase [Candidatus Cloacimonetes bacterium HGW-Cloacimonetes-2]|jgi:dihydrolipoamide dehydrogenase|nr:MAG: dihydrolipoyl dehydrogenase [Candidatus Cloacimonetes bacterium HGW-Cloacimonetes-2]
MNYDLIIIGSGPAGYVAAIRAGQTGLKTLVIDKKYIGGMCLNWGCIPTKSLIESAKLYYKIKNAADFGINGIKSDELSFDWKKAVQRTESVVKRLSRGIEFLWKKNGVEFLSAEAKIVSPTQVEAGNQIFETKHIMIATGSRPAHIDEIPEALDLESLLAMESLPNKPLLWGGGAITLELAQFFKMIGLEPVIVSSSEQLVPGLDQYLESYVTKRLKKDKIQVIKRDELTIKDGKIIMGDKALDNDLVINTSLRRAVLPGIWEMPRLDKGYIKVDEYLRTSHPTIYAAGDVNGLSYLAHSASAQGLAVIDHIHGKAEPIELLNSPVNIYSNPEIAQIGITEAIAKEQGLDYAIGEYSLAANGKALTEGSSEGFLRLIYEKKYRQVLGVQIVAENATDMISEAGILMELEGTVYDLAKTIHAHPTVSEIFMELGAQESMN